MSQLPYTPRLSKRTSWLIRAAISVAVLTYVFTQIEGDRLVEAILATDPLWYGLTLLLMIPVGLSAAAQQRVLTDRQRMGLSTGEILKINLVTSFYGLFLPGQLAGGVIRWHRMAGMSRKGAEAFAAIAFNRLLDTLLTVGMGLAFWIVASPEGSSGWITATLIMVMVGLLAAEAMFFNRGFSNWVTRMARKVRILPDPVRRVIIKVAVAAAEFDRLPLRDLATVVSLGLARHAIAVANVVILAIALGITVDWLTLGWIRSILTIVAFLPISIAGLGVREVTLVALLESYGVSGADAVALSFLMLSRDLLKSLTGGLVELFRVLPPLPWPFHLLQQRDGGPRTGSPDSGPLPEAGPIPGPAGPGEARQEAVETEDRLGASSRSSR